MAGVEAMVTLNGRQTLEFGTAEQQRSASSGKPNAYKLTSKRYGSQYRMENPAGIQSQNAVRVGWE